MTDAITDAERQPAVWFEVSDLDGKYTVRAFNGGGYEILRHGEPWIARDDATTMKGTNAFFALADTLYAYQSGQGSHPGEMPLETAQRIVAGEKLPHTTDGSSLLPVPYNRVVDLVAKAITLDRRRGPINPTALVDRIFASSTEHDALIDGELAERIKGLMRLAIVAAQARGARIPEQKKPIDEDDYAEASRAGHEAFMAVLKDKGLVP